MTEKKRRRYPADRLKLHALQEHLEAKILADQKTLTEVKKLVQKADEAAILETAKEYKITPEELAMVLRSRQSEEMPDNGTDTVELDAQGLEAMMKTKEDEPDDDA